MVATLMPYSWTSNCNASTEIVGMIVLYFSYLFYKLLWKFLKFCFILCMKIGE